MSTVLKDGLRIAGTAFAFAAVAMAAAMPVHASEDAKTLTEAERARQERAESEAERTRDLMDDQHRDWLRQQQDLKYRIQPVQPDLDVPIYTAPPRLY
ncbi:MAG: hypothetical protein K5863_06715 [Nitratireductor sp.]|uniref:hypothetical protein n=1 Tax=Nitratireductor sp. TaxID=1872084 RepID=UPI0026099718|nr:hypothetical protein [Nitratireductor sp.]MCV0349751.1 hypothetical protein [Nitratireductor sp.]